MNIALLLQMAAEGMEDRVAIGLTADGLTYGTLLKRVAAAASLINDHDVERVAYVGLNSPTFPVALFGASAAGKALVPLNYRLPDDDLRRLAARTAPSLIVVDDDILHRVEGVAGVEIVTRSAFETACRNTEAEFPDELAEEGIALLLFTSGTTGEPKAAVLRQQNLTSYVVSTVEFMGAGEEEAILVSVPPYHIAGVAAVLTAIYNGRRMVQLPAFTPADWVKTAAAEAITHAMVVPTMLGRILDELESTGERLPALRHLSYGGGRMPLPVIERALDLLPNVNFVNAYGLTETSSTISVLHPDDHRTAHGHEDPVVRRRLGSVGRPLPSLELDIRDIDGNAVPAGTPGEIWVRGEQVSGEYLSGKRIRDDGWLPTNDCGWLDEEGYLFIDGRLDDVIVRGGENISPGEIEDVLLAHEAIDDVAVIGLPDNEWGERIVAVAVVKISIDEDVLKQWVRDRLRSTKVPERIFFHAELPFNETGKLLRRVLKSQLVASSADA